MLSVKIFNNLIYLDSTIKDIIMNEAQVISVNPGTKTLGELNISENKLSRISRRLTAPARNMVSPFKKIVDLLFGLNSKVNAQFSGKMMLLRLLFGSLLIASVLLPMHPDDILALDFGPHSIALIIFGVSMVFGFLSRLVSLGCAGWFGYRVYASIMVANPDITAVSLLMFAVMFWVLGPGLYSVDQMIRHILFTLSSKYRQRQIRNRMIKASGYRAYSSVADRVL